MPAERRPDTLGMAQEPRAQDVAVAGIFIQRHFRTLGLRRRPRHDFTRVYALRPLPQRRSGLAESAPPELLAVASYLAAGLHAKLGKVRGEMLPDTGNSSHGKAFKEAGHGFRPQQKKSIRLALFRGYFRKEFHGSYAHRAGQAARSFTHSFLELAPQLLHRPEKTFEPRGIKISLVHGSHFHERRKTGKRFAHDGRHLCITAQARAEINAVRTASAGLCNGHGRMDAELPRLVGAGAHHTAVLAAHDERPPPQGRIVELFDGCEEGIHVHMHYPALMRHGRPLVFHAGNAPGGGLSVTLRKGLSNEKVPVFYHASS